jgi:hypothetical protein
MTDPVDIVPSSLRWAVVSCEAASCTVNFAAWFLVQHTGCGDHELVWVSHIPAMVQSGVSRQQVRWHDALSEGLRRVL